MRRMFLMGVVLIGLPLQAQLNANELMLLDQSIKENASSHLAFLQELIRTTEEGEEAVHALVAGSLAMIPKKCTIGGSVTFPPEEKLEDAEREIADCIHRVAQNDP